MKKHLLSIAALLAAVWFLYFQTGDFEFLRLDDHDYTFRCTFVKDGLSCANVQEAFANPRHAAIWMPATYVSYMADISLFGPAMRPHHLVNVAIHSLNAILIYMLLLALLARRGEAPEDAPACLAALLAAAFWALHPQRAEAVAWIAGRKELLCAFFSLAGLLCWIRRGRLGILAACLCCAGACLSKPTAMCFPFLAFACDWFVDRRPPSRAQLLRFAPLLAMAVATGAVAVYSQTHPEGLDELPLFTAALPWRLLNAAVATGLYLFQTVCPVGIHLDYHAVPGHFPVHGLLGLSALAGAGCLAFWGAGRACRGTKSLLASPLLPLLLFFMAGLAPTLGVFGSFGEHARADRFLYLPAVATALVFALAFLRLARRSRQTTQQKSTTSRTGLPGLIGALAVLGVLCASFPVVASFRNDHTAFSRTLAFEPDNGRALAHVASEACARFGQIDRGINLFRRSQELRPRDGTAAQLAYALALRGLSSDYGEIRTLCAKFACDHSLDPKGQALEALGATAMRQRRWNEAISLLEDSIKAPRRFYSDEDARLRLGACYCNAKRPEDAIRVFEPLTQSRRTDIAGRARQFLSMVRKNPRSLLLF